MTFDHLGGIGSFVEQFFFGTSQSLITASTQIPTWSPQSFPNNPDAYILYQRTTTQTPKNILSRADFHWFHGSHQSRPYGPTYHTASPSAWATQTLALNLTQGLAQHCHNAIANFYTITKHKDCPFEKLNTTSKLFLLSSSNDPNTLTLPLTFLLPITPW
jgi:hypothetical protein